MKEGEKWSGNFIYIFLKNTDERKVKEEEGRCEGGKFADAYLLASIHHVDH